MIVPPEDFPKSVESLVPQFPPVQPTRAERIAHLVMEDLRKRRSLGEMLGAAPDKESGLPWITLETQEEIERRIAEIIEGE